MTKVTRQYLLKKKEDQLAEAKEQLEHDKNVLNLLESSVPFSERNVSATLCRYTINSKYY